MLPPRRSGKLPWKHRDSSIGRIVENTIWLMAGKGVGGVLSLVYLAIVTRSLGPDGFGHFALILSTAQIISVFVSFETWQIIVKFGQTHVQDGSRERFGRLLTFCIAIDAAGAIVGCLIAGAMTFLLGPRFGWEPMLAREAFAFCAVMLLTIRSTPMGILRLFDRFDAGAFAETMVPVGRMIGAGIVWMATPGITAFLIVWAAAELLCAATYWTLALRTARKHMGKWSKRRFLEARYENEGLLGFLTATNVSTTVTAMTKQISVLVVGFFAGAADAGLYRLAYQLSVSLAKISSLLSRTIFAELAKVHSSRPAEDLMNLFRRTNRLAIIAGGVIILLILTLGHPLLLLVAGREFAGAYPLLVLLGIAASIDLIGVSFEPLLMATNHASASMKIKFFNALLLVGMLTVLLPVYGPAGAAMSNVAIACIGIVLMGWMARKVIRQG